MVLQAKRPGRMLRRFGRSENVQSEDSGLGSQGTSSMIEKDKIGENDEV